MEESHIVRDELPCFWYLGDKETLTHKLSLLKNERQNHVANSVSKRVESKR